MLINDQVKNTIFDQYKKMKTNGVKEEEVSLPELNKLTLYIGKKPAYPFPGLGFEFDGESVWIGSDTM